MANNVKVSVNTTKLNQILRAMPGNASHAVETIAREIETKIKVSMGEEKHGLIYALEGGGAHQASAPGEAPAIDTGYLVNSIMVEMVGPASAIVYTNAEYAAELEFGALNLAPRPFFQPAVNAVTAVVERDPAEYFRNVVEG